MTRKDYELIAAAIVATRNRIGMTEHDQVDQLRGVRRTAAHLAEALATDNPRFDQVRFLKACGY